MLVKSGVPRADVELPAGHLAALGDQVTGLKRVVLAGFGWFWLVFGWFLAGFHVEFGLFGRSKPTLKFLFDMLGRNILTGYSKQKHETTVTHRESFAFR